VTGGDEAAVVRACAALARRLGLGRVEPRVIGRFSNLALALAPTPWVARVATGTAGPRAEPAWAVREIALARALHARGAPVGAPAPGALAGPHVEAGWRITLWQRLDLIDAVPSPEAAGRALAACHAALADLPDRLAPDLPPAVPWAPLDEALRLLALPRVRERAGGASADEIAERLAEVRAALLRHAAPCQWLHGDAQVNNVRTGTDGVVRWLDWEDTCRAPLEWDLAGLVGAGRVLGGAESAWAEAALAGWRTCGPALDTALLDACIEARALFVVAWTWWLGPDQPGRRERLAARLAWLRQRAAGVGVRPRPAVADRP
jgi:hypothetical protein